MLDHLNSQVFTEQLNTTFHLQVPGAASVPIELFEVSEKDPSAAVEQFSLMFRGPLAPFCTQAIYTLEHEKLGKFDLFLVPLGPDSAGMRYQVIFSRLRQPRR